MKSAAVVILALGPAAFAQSAPPRLEFEVATVRPFAPQMPDGGLRMSGTQADPGMIRMMAVTLRDCVRQAYAVKDYQIEGPAWTATERYDITAKVPPGTTPEQRRAMEQNLLADRFRLKIHNETKEMQVYALMPAKGGVKVQPDPADAKPGYTRFKGAGHIEAVRLSFAQFAETISRFVDHPVVDRTDTPGLFDFKLDFAMDPALLMLPGTAAKAAARAESPDQDLPSIFTAVQTLGLKLEPLKQSTEIIVIDHAEKTPIEN